ncbi:MAG: winged helix-turn-helix transcriptional regulator, partial [Hyphomicrobium denitrificans]|nr:winged helix-turn-helix transcriptional regulator [Hyphomicrobium denitrificans]
LEIDLVSRKVTRGGDTIDLQPREFRLLEVLMRNRGRVVTRTMLLERVWSFHFDPKTSVVETHISRLRAKIDKPYETELIHTIRGCGYTVNDGA